MLVFPSKVKMNEGLARGLLPHLSGFMRVFEDGTGFLSNFILSNGDKSAQTFTADPEKSYQGPFKTTDYAHFLPQGAHNRIRSVKIRDCMGLVSFYDKDGELIWETKGDKMGMSD